MPRCDADGSHAHPPKDERTTPHPPVSIASPTRHRPFVPPESQLSRPLASTPPLKNKADNWVVLEPTLQSLINHERFW